MSEQQPNPAEFSSFADWCLHKDSLSQAAKYTVELLLRYAGTSDINEANRILSSSNELSMCNNLISDITPLQSLTNLTYLDLHCNQISDITPLQSLTNLTYLDLHCNQILDITPLQSCAALTNLNLEKNQISDLTPLQSCAGLTNLNLCSNQILNITPLQSCAGLTHLYLHCNQILDITPLQSCAGLTHLRLDNNQISDLTPLQSCAGLIDWSVDFTPEQKALIEACRQKWGTLANSTESISPPKPTAAVKAVYEAIGLEPPEITFCSSPNGALAQIQILKMSNETELIQRLDKLVKDALHPFPLIMELLWELSGLIIIWEQQLNQQLNEEFSGYWNYLTSSVTPKYVVEALAVAEFCVSGFGVVLKPEAQKVFECLNQLLAECGWIILLDDTCIVCSRPCQLRLDSEYRLHAEGEPALEFPDGYKIYSYHGVTLPENYGQIHPNLWQAQWLLEEKNAELRRVLIQGIGYARICSELQATELDCWKEYTLLKIDADIDGFDPDDFEDDEDAPKKEDIYLLKMTCPSTGHIHALRVPPDVTSAKEAIRWVNWDIDSEEFSVQT